MNCPQCGTGLPDGARFCYSCGATVGPAASRAPPPPPSPPTPPTGASRPTLAPVGAQELKCPACGAPIHPVFGEMVITCDYCGGSVTLGGGGWKEINKHTMLPLKVGKPEDALGVVRQQVDTGFFHRHDFEDSKIAEQKLSWVPFWVIPASATTSYRYQDVAVGVGGTAAEIGAVAVLGAALGGRGRGGFVPVPLVMGPPVNPTRQSTLTGSYEYPVVAVKSMTAYQPKNYQFALGERTFFDRKQIPEGSPILNGDLGEDAAQHSARAYVMQLQSEQAHHQHRMVSALSTQVEVAEGELVHVPVWYFVLDRKGQKSMILVDGHAAKIIQTIGGPGTAS